MDNIQIGDRVRFQLAAFVDGTGSESIQGVPGTTIEFSPNRGWDSPARFRVAFDNGETQWIMADCLTKDGVSVDALASRNGET